MSNGRDIFLKLCEAPDIQAAAQALTADEITTVAAYLAKKKLRGISAQVWGVIQQFLTEPKS